MSIYARDDLVSLSRAQTSLLRLTGSTTPGTVFTIQLPINPGDVRPFSYTTVTGDDLTAVAVQLEQEVTVQQSVYSIAVGTRPDELVITGPLGQSFDVLTTANILASIYEEAVSAVNTNTGEQIRNIRVLLPFTPYGNGQLREYTTRDPSGRLRDVNMLMARELESGDIFDLDAQEVRTRVKPALPLPFVPGRDGGEALEGRGGWLGAWACDEAQDDTWPAVELFGSTTLSLTRTAGAGLPAQPTEVPFEDGIGWSRANRALRAGPGLLYNQGGLTGPSNLPDLSGETNFHVRFLAQPPVAFPASAVGAPVINLVDGAQDLRVGFLLPPSAPVDAQLALSM